MISDYVSFNQNGLVIEANYNEAVKPSEVLRFTIDGKVAYMDRAHLYELLFLFGNEEQQEQLVPVREESVKEVTRLLKVRARKNIKKGEIIAVPYTTFVPVGIYEKLRLTPLDSGRMEKLVNKQVIT